MEPSGNEAVLNLPDEAQFWIDLDRNGLSNRETFGQRVIPDDPGDFLDKIRRDGHVAAIGRYLDDPDRSVVPRVRLGHEAESLEDLKHLVIRIVDAEQTWISLRGSSIRRGNRGDG